VVMHYAAFVKRFLLSLLVEVGMVGRWGGESGDGTGAFGDG
jgi:hypothetical protein